MSKKEVKVTIHLTEVIYDIQNKTYISGEVAGASGDSAEQVAMQQADSEDWSENQIMRSIGNSFSRIQSSISEYWGMSSADETNTQMQSGARNPIIKLYMPMNYNATTLRDVSQAIHQTLVYQAIGDWYMLVRPSGADVWHRMADDQIGRLRLLLSRRLRPSRQ